MLRLRNHLVTRTALTGALAALAACRGEPAPDAAVAPPAGTITLTEVQRRTAGLAVETTRLDTLAVPLRVPGTVITPEPATASVGSYVEGRVDELFVIPGDRVRAGQELLHIHSHELSNARRDLAQAEAQVQYAKAAWDRSARLLEAEAVPREEVERRRTALVQAEAERARSAEIVTHLHPKDDDVSIIAPRGGVVFAVHVRTGDAVTPGHKLVDLGDPSRLWVTGFIPENAAVRFTNGSGVGVTFDALPGVRVEGRVVRVGGAIDSLRRALEVRVELARVPDGVRPGMFATLDLPDAAREGRVVLPADAVQRTPEGEVVYLEEATGRFRPRHVATRALGDGRVAVDSLVAGLRVVTKGAYYLRAAREAQPMGDE